MPGDERRFTAVIEDSVLGERFSATVTVKKRLPIRTSLQTGKVDLVDVFIAPISGQLLVKVHHHFVIHDFTGRGIYIVRDQNGNDERRRQCTIWELGHSFGVQVMTALKSLA
ncbi:MAG: hypothetical protein ACJ746_20705 [Bryobacteraceae bacterium]